MTRCSINQRSSPFLVVAAKHNTAGARGGPMGGSNLGKNLLGVKNSDTRPDFSGC